MHFIAEKCVLLTIKIGLKRTKTWNHEEKRRSPSLEVCFCLEVSDRKVEREIHRCYLKIVNLFIGL